MFGALRRIANNTKNLDGNQVLHKTLDNTLIQHDIIALNQNQLYEQGVFADGKPTGHYAASSIEGTKNFKGKKEKGQRYDHITFSDTFDMYKSMRFKNGKDEFHIEADTVKEGVDLESFYGDIIGLTDNSIKETRGYVLPGVIKNSLSYIHNGK